MPVTPLLEKMILAGKADYLTYTIGGSGVGTIPFSSNLHSMVVVDILWQPFNDQADPINQSNAAVVVQHIIHNMTLWDGKKKAVYAFRDNVWKPIQPVIEITPGLLWFNGNTVLPAFYRTQANINVNIYNVSSMARSTYASDVIPVTTQEQASPNGYGGITAVRAIEFAEDPLNPATVVNLGRFREPAALAATKKKRNEYFDIVNNSTRLRIPDKDTGHQQFSFPLVTFGVVQIYENPETAF